eukprot:TRINITY_DN47902_c0_g1_i1.p1 TRINITY_DN47902_c0_g1~~TRINITY_DN47902_c0_g1_i1.p1  ORF type:complete len:358 (-),score=57.21 TRINITY_DN47902_c0_g1_i1:83-1156(-)
MAPKKMKKSQSRSKLNDSSDSTFGGTSVTSGETSPNTSTMSSPKSRSASRKNTQSKDKASWLDKAKEAEKAPEPDPYLGPRPDEDLLEVVREEAEEGRRERIVIPRDSVELVYAMLRSGEDVNQRSSSGYHCLSIAAAAGNAELVSLLLERHANVALANVHRSELPLHLAARGGYVLICQQLIALTKEAGLLDKPNTTGWPPLHLAVSLGHTAVVNLLIKSRADIRARNMVLGGFTVLHLGCIMGHHATVESLIDQEADITVQDNLGRTCLHLAVISAMQPTVSLLLRCKGDVNKRVASGENALELAEANLHKGVPLDQQAVRQKIVTLLQAYSRPTPEPPRTDVHFQRDTKYAAFD